MTDASHTPLQILGDPDAIPGEGEAGIGGLPERHEHAIMNRRLDEDAV
jgi:hypothetical protein